MQLIQDRRALHRIPEPDMRLSKTMAYLHAALEALPCQVFSPIPNALCAWFDFGAAKTIAFRADCDALPITETNTHAFVSCHEGYMHACGHDGHMAIALELARRLSEKASLPNNVLLIFQPAEETMGGAKPICQSGVLERFGVEAVFGLHLWPGLEPGVIHSRKGPLMSRVSEITVEVTGRSAHIGKPWEAIDALEAGAELYRRARALERSLDPQIPRLLNFGKMESGTVRNIISGRTLLEGTLRTYSDHVFDQLLEGLRQICSQIREEFGCQVDLTATEGYPAVTNDAALLDKVRTIAPVEILPDPTMISEDFSWYQRYVPGVFFFLGLGDTPALHSANFDFEEKLLYRGVEFFETLAEQY